MNPSAKSILSVRAYPKLMEIPDDIDLAIIILPPAVAVKAVYEAVEKNVKVL